MKFKLDENLPVDAADYLNRIGHDTLTVLDQKLGGQADSKIISVCTEEKRILVTLDLDFADINQYPPKNHFGIIVLRLKLQNKQSVLEAVEHFSKMLADEKIEQHLWIVEENRIRIRE